MFPATSRDFWKGQPAWKDCHVHRTISQRRHLSKMKYGLHHWTSSSITTWLEDTCNILLSLLMFLCCAATYELHPKIASGSSSATCSRELLTGWQLNIQKQISEPRRSETIQTKNTKQMEAPHSPEGIQHKITKNALRLSWCSCNIVILACKITLRT